MQRCQQKCTINNSQYSMSQLKPRKPSTMGSDNCCIAEAQGNDLKIAFWNMIEVLDEEVNKSFKEI